MSTFEQIHPAHTPSHPRLPVAGHTHSRTPHGNVRRRGRDRWQARIYVGGRKGGAVHLGMYESETAAEQVAKRVLRTLLASAGGAGTAALGPLDVWKAARRLAGGGWDVGGQLAGLLPRWVCEDGVGGYGVRVRGGNGCDRGGFGSVDEAYAEACRIRGGISECRRWRRSALVQMTVLGALNDDEVIACGGMNGEGASNGERGRSTAGLPVRRKVVRRDNPHQLTIEFEGCIDAAGGVDSSDGVKSHTASFAGRSVGGREIVA